MALITGNSGSQSLYNDNQTGTMATIIKPLKMDKEVSHQERISRLTEIAKEDGIRGKIAGSILCPRYTEHESDLPDFFNDILQDGKHVGTYIESKEYWEAINRVRRTVRSIANEIALWE